MKPVLTLTGPERYRLANTEFVPSLTVEDSTASLFRLHMSAEAIEAFPRLSSLLRFKTVLELLGEDVGSVALISLVGAPNKLVAVTTARDLADLVIEFARRRGIEDRMRVYRGADLTRTARLVEVIEKDFGPAGPEVVFDDLSENYEAGARAFEVIFPLLAPGGSYVIARWCWDHFILEGLLDESDADASFIEEQRGIGVALVDEQKGQVLEAILPRLVNLVQRAPDVVSAVTANKHWLAVQRGPAKIDAASFRLPPP